MPRILQRVAFACLALMLGVAQAVGAGERRSPLDTAMALTPGPDGTYALPLLEGGLLPLSFEPGETRLELAAVSFEPASGTLRATLRHAGERSLSAWSVELTTFSDADEPLAALTRTEDWAASDTDRTVRRSRAAGLSTLAHDHGLLVPGQIHRIELGVPLPGHSLASSPVRAVLSIPVVVSADASFTGSRRQAREILGSRKAAAEELAYWSVRLKEAVQGAASDEEALEAVRSLRRELRDGSAQLPHSARAVRKNLRSELQSVVAIPTGDPAMSVREELLSLSDWVRLRFEERSRHVPGELPGGPASTVGEGGLQERFHEGGSHEDTNSDDTSCECGGSIFTSVAQSQTRVCDGSATGWRVDELWSYTCRNEDGFTINSGTGSLKGYGGCIRGVTCFPDKDCPPFFGVPVETEDFDYHIWNRTVTNYKLLVGVCTARCSQDSSASLTLKCQCSPRRQPGCSIDGCPILIETGAGGYHLTDLEGGVRFDLDADGEAERLSWTVEGTDDAWLALDRNGNGAIDDGTELFGDATPQPASDERHGFAALAVFDEPSLGGDGDGRITAADGIWPDLLLWLDRDHDGVSQPSELSGLGEAGVVALELDYHASHRRDRYGNRFRYAAGVWYASGARRPAVDVFLLLEAH